MRALILIFAFLAISPGLAETNDVYVLMRAALHPTIRAQLAALDKEYTNRYPTPNTNLSTPQSVLPSDRILDWIVHASLPTVTNEATFFDSYKTTIPPSTLSTFSTLLTNRAARLSYIPPIVNLSLVYDDGTKYARTRPIPGIDYPGVSYEDEGSTPDCIRLTLRAPKSYRQLKLRADIVNQAKRTVEFKWCRISGPASFSHISSVESNPYVCIAYANVAFNAAKKTPSRMAVFAREKGGMWGLPAFVEISADPLCEHRYSNGQIEYIDYGAFRDVYKLDGQNRILGFERILPGMVRGDDYSNFGEKIIDTYTDDKPKTTRKVRYAIEKDKLTYIILNEDIYYKNGPFQFRPINF